VAIFVRTFTFTIFHFDNFALPEARLEFPVTGPRGFKQSLPAQIITLFIN